MKKNTDKEYYLTRGEYAKKINKSKGSVIQSMRRGGLEDEYIFTNNQYFFRSPKAKRENKGQYTDTKYTPKKKYNRGNHFNAHYPNAKFKLHNELKMLAKLKGITDKEVLDNLPAAIEHAKKIKYENKQSALNKISTKNYGGFISNQQLNRDKFNPTNKGKVPKKKTYY